MSDESATPAEVPLLTFEAGGQPFAVPLAAIDEIVAHRPCTRVPQLPPAIHGVMNLRGGVVPVIDLGLVLGLGAAALTRKSCVMLVNVDVAGERATLGILVDRVTELVELGAGDVKPPPPFGAPVRLDFLHGVAGAGERVLLLLDLARVLTPDELLATMAGLASGLVTS